MKLVIVLLCFGTFVLRAAEGEQPANPGSHKNQVSAAVGAYIGDYWKRQGVQVEDLDWPVVMEAFKAKVAGAPSSLNDRQIRDGLHLLSADMKQRHEQKQRELAEKNKRDGDAFRAQYKAKPGVHVLPSGLHYKVIAEGSGRSPTTNDSVVVKYKGTLVDGREITSPGSQSGSQPPIPLQGPKGFVEALQLMKPGAKWEVVLPPELAHGERGSYPLVPPNSTLIYDIELVSVLPGAFASGPK